MASEGELWKQQRRTTQPAFEGAAMANYFELILATNLKLLDKWQLAAEHREAVNVTRDVRGMALELMLRSIFSDDYDEIAAAFDLLSSEHIRGLAFARRFARWGRASMTLRAEEAARVRFLPTS